MKREDHLFACASCCTHTVVIVLVIMIVAFFETLWQRNLEKKRPMRPTHTKHGKNNNNVDEDGEKNRLCCYKKNLVNVCELKFKMAEFQCMEYFISHVYERAMNSRRRNREEEEKKSLKHRGKDTKIAPDQIFIYLYRYCWLQQFYFFFPCVCVELRNVQWKSTPSASLSR